MALREYFQHLPRRVRLLLLTRPKPDHITRSLELKLRPLTVTGPGPHAALPSLPSMGRGPESPPAAAAASVSSPLLSAVLQAVPPQSPSRVLGASRSLAGLLRKVAGGATPNDSAQASPRGGPLQKFRTFSGAVTPVSSIARQSVNGFAEGLPPPAHIRVTDAGVSFSPRGSVNSTPMARTSQNGTPVARMSQNGTPVGRASLNGTPARRESEGGGLAEGASDMTAEAALYSAYAAMFHGHLHELPSSRRGLVVSLLELLAAALEPLPLCVLSHLGLAQALPLLPGWGTAFHVQDFRLQVVNRSLIEWLRGAAAAPATKAASGRGAMTPRTSMAGQQLQAADDEASAAAVLQGLGMTLQAGRGHAALVEWATQDLKARRPKVRQGQGSNLIRGRQRACVRVVPCTYVCACRSNSGLDSTPSMLHVHAICCRCRPQGSLVQLAPQGKAPHPDLWLCVHWIVELCCCRRTACGTPSTIWPASPWTERSPMKYAPGISSSWTSYCWTGASGRGWAVWGREGRGKRRADCRSGQEAPAGLKPRTAVPTSVG